MTDLKSSLLKLNKNLNILKEREAKYANHAPLELLNQIDDHEQAINLVEQAIVGEITEVALFEAIQPLVLAVTHGQVVNIEADTYIAGDVKGDIVGGDKVSGDKVITNIYETPKHRIPLQRPPRAEYFTNRRQELGQLLADLQPGRVVTLCGPGGIGKSALAAEAIWTMAPEDDPPDLFPDGILFYSFDNQSQTELALESIVRAFGEEPKPTPKDAAQRTLAGRRALLLLESAEEADNLPVVLAVAGGCGVLVTSRKKQDATAERQDVAPLPIDEAITLLQTWGRRQTADTSAARRICELIGGLPLAVRLVGRYLDETGETATEYLDWLAETPLEALDPFGEQRRLQSVPWLLGHSLDQVSEAAVQVLAAIGLLALAPFSVKPIASAMAWSVRQTRQRLGELVSYGLLRRSGDQYEASHPLIHTYARQRLVTSIEMMRRLAEYYTVLTEEQSKFNAEGYIRLDTVRVHLLRILTVCEKQEEWEATRRLTWAIDQYLDRQGLWFERVTTLKAGITAAQALGSRRDEGVFLGKLGHTYRGLGQIKEAIKTLEQALAIHHEIGNQQEEVKCLGNLGSAYIELGQQERAIMYFEQAGSSGFGGLGRAYLGLGEIERSIEYTEQAMIQHRETGNRRDEGYGFANLGSAYRRLGQFERARECHMQALAISREIGVRALEGMSLSALGDICQRLGQARPAIDYHKRALTIHREIGYRQKEAETLGNLGSAYYSVGQMEQAIECYEQTLSIFSQTGHRKNEGWYLIKLGSSYRALGQYEQAVEYCRQALTIAREIDDHNLEGYDLLVMGSINRLREDYDEALANFEKTTELNPNFEDWCCYERGLIYLTNDNPDQAQAELSRAIDLARQKYEENTQNWGNIFNLALYSVAIGDVEAAEPFYRKAIESSPPLNIIREAVRDLDEFLDLFPEHGQAQAMRGLLHQSL
ncbi:MAG: tetratricopeptide repeat protein [Anaerolineae bacterium]|nr:tetratricopeptide repeat protein [Anaerolineae bacterium]